MSFVILYDVSLRDFAALEHARRTSLFGKVVIPTTRCVKDRSLPTVFNTNNTQKNNERERERCVRRGCAEHTDPAFGCASPLTCALRTGARERRRPTDTETTERDCESGPNTVTISEYRF